MSSEKTTAKSVHITNYYHKNSGGISTAYNHLLEEANRRQRQVRLIVPGERDEQQEIGKFGRIYYVKANPAPIFDRRYRLIMPWQYVPESAVIRQILLSEMPDIIEIAEKYTVSLLAGMIKKGYFTPLGRPMLVHLSCERMDDNLRAFVSGAKPFRWLARRVMGNYIFPMFDYHLANSQYTAQELIDAVSAEKNPGRSEAFFNLCCRFFKSVPDNSAEKVFVNNCGVDGETFSVSRKSQAKRREILAESGFPENATVLLYAGRISPEKNIILLPKILNSLLKFRSYDTERHEYCLLVAGDGPQKDWLERQLRRRAAGRYKIFGHIAAREKLADIYANSDVFIHTNPREPFGIAPLEAMASGLPVVAPNSGGVLSYANDENAWLTRPDAKNYYAAVRDIFSDNERRERKVKNALLTARNYTWENSTGRLFEMYDRMFANFQEQKYMSPDRNAAVKIDSTSKQF